jgi:hypothetical protein
MYLIRIPAGGGHAVAVPTTLPAGPADGRPADDGRRPAAARPADQARAMALPPGFNRTRLFGVQDDGAVVVLVDRRSLVRYDPVTGAMTELTRISAPSPATGDQKGLDLYPAMRASFSQLSAQ